MTSEKIINGYQNLKKASTLKIEEQSAIISQCDSKRNDIMHYVELNDISLISDEKLRAIMNELTSCLRSKRTSKDIIDMIRQFENLGEIKVNQSLNFSEKDIQDFEECLAELEEDLEKVRKENKKINFHEMMLIMSVEKNLEVAKANIKDMEELHKNRLYTRRTNIAVLD